MTSPAGTRIPWHRSLRVRLVVYFVALSVATVAAVGLLAYTRASTDLRTSIFDRLEAVATLKADSLGRWLDEQRRNIVFVGSIPDVRELSAQVVAAAEADPTGERTIALKDQLREELDLLVTGTSDASTISIIGLDGRVLVSTTKVFEGRNVASAPYYIRGRTKTSIQNVYTSQVDARPTITVSTPLLDSARRRIGVLAANLDIGRLDRIMSERSGLGQTGETYLVDAGGRFVGNESQGRAVGGGLASSAGIDAAVAGGSGRGTYENYAGAPVVGVYRWLPDQEVALLAEVGQAEALAPAQDLSVAIGLFGLASAALLAVGIWFIARQVTRPISRLTTAAQAVAAGDLDARSGVRGRDEVGVLAATFDSMAIQLQESVTTLERRVEERTADLTAALAAKSEADERYRQMVEQVPAITYMDVTGKGTVYVSPQIERMLGVTQEAYISDPDLWRKLLHPEDRDAIDALYESWVDGTGEDLPDYRMVRPDGSTIWIRDRAEEVRDEEGRIVQEHGVMFDVTELKETEAAMAAQAAKLAKALEAQVEAEQRYRNLVELLPLTVYVDDVADTVVSAYVSPQAEQMYGYPPERWSEPGFFESVLHPDDRERIPAELAAIDDTGLDRYTQEYRVIAADGRVVWVHDEAVKVRDPETGEHRYVQGFTQDVTERVLAQREVERQKQYFEALVDISPVAIVTMDRELRVSGWNPAAERLFGYTPEEAIGRDIDDLVILDPELRADSMDHDRSHRTQTAHHITKRQRKDGSFVDVEIVGVPLEVNGEFTGYYAIYHDISELQAARRDADEANQAKSTFLAAMSHEIRTPMNAIIGMSGLLLNTPLDEEQRDFADTIQTSADALLTIINDILDFSKIEAGRFDLDHTPFSLAQVVDGAVAVLAPTAVRKGLELRATVDPAVPERLLGDAGRVRQILLNLLSNSVKFTETGEVVMDVRAAPASRHGELRCWEIAIDVRDTGLGIPPERMDKLFQSFSQGDASISRRFGGTGLGLAISRRLAELMDGSLEAESTGVPGEGATFHLRFQAEAADASLSAATAERALSVPGGLAGRRALVVDDNAAHRRILVAHLDAWGMPHRETGSPAEALAWVRRGERFDVALLDVVMPEMDGVALATALGALDAAPPVILLSEFGPREDAPAAVAGSVAKPIVPSVLHDSLVTVLTGRAPVVATAAAVAPVLDPELAVRHPLRILLAEDNVVNVKLAAKLLGQMGYAADVAANGREAVDALEAGSYDLVLMDVQMPELDGLEATREIRVRWPDRRLRIVGLTANAMAGDREACLAAGMDDYVSKPIRPDALAAALAATPSPSSSEVQA
ncbi:MAG TPA: PAS domain S-box protein [Candidatus Limnocylindrales bacterium]|nr:PAS domain S-box protein [Candidatus Limnocylindrales bacterium]